MKNGKILWIKQKAIGLILIIIPIVYIERLLQSDAGLFIPIYWLIGSIFICTKEKIFRSDYIFDVKLFIRIIRRKLRRRKVRRIRSRRL